MAVIPVSPFVADYTFRRSRRCFCVPQWLRERGVFQPIGRVIGIDAKQDRSWEITIGNKSITLTPDTPTRSAIDAGQVRAYRESGRRRFGPILRRTDTPDFMRFNITHSAGVTRRRNGDYLLETRDGVKLGLFFRDWRSRFVFSRVDDEISLDLRDEKARAEQEGEDEINVDPTTIDLDDSYNSYYVVESESWATCRDAATSQGDNSTMLVRAHKQFGSNFNVYRAALRFDTSAVSKLESQTATLHVYVTTGTGTIHGSLCTFDTPIDADAYGQIKSGYTDTPIGQMTLGESGGDGTLDIPHAQYSQSAAFDIGLANYTYDVSNVQPTSNHTATLDEGSNAPYIEVSDAPASGPGCELTQSQLLRPS